MKKLKTRKTLAKRIKVTKNGKVMVGALRNGHLKRKFSANRKYRKKGLRSIESASFKTKFKNLLGEKGRRINV